MPLLEDRSSDEIETMKRWAKVRQHVEERFAHKPDIQTCLFLIGVNELGEVREFTKEEKQDLIHVGMCTVLIDTHYISIGKDEDGWPHFENIQGVPEMFIKNQESLLKEKIITYFEAKVFE